MDKMSIKGVAISLKKRGQNLLQSFNEDYQYIVFGHYDGMDIIPIEEFGDFRPASIAQKPKEDKVFVGITDKYTIKALCIPSEEYKYDYTKRDEAYPFVSCIMFHLSKQCVQENKIVDILKKISETLKNKNYQNVKYNVYCSIGYSDIIILVRSKNFDIVGSFVSTVNNISCEYEYNWVSAVYTIVGFEKSAFSSVTDIQNAYKCPEMQNDMGFCISLGLHAGFSFETFKNILQESISNTLNKCGYTYQVGELDKCIWTTFGNTDVIFNINLPMALFPALYSEECEGIFAPGLQLFKKYITSIKVSVLSYKNYQKFDCMDQNQNKYNINDDTLSRYENFLVNLGKNAKKQNLPQRIVAAVRQILELYKTLAEQPHGFEVKQIIGKAIDAFIDNMELSIELLEQDMGENCVERGQSIIDIEEAVGKFRNYIVTYLSDLHRSERSFIEGRTMTHPSIGALTKLLFSYNVFINDLAEKYKSDKEKYSFVIVSGGCDQTQVHEVFRFIGSWRPEYNHLFIISIPEISLFDIGGTLFRLSHECFHCFGARYRIERKYYVMRSWARYISEKISEKIFSPNVYSLDSLKLLGDTEIWATIIKEQKRFSENFYQKLVQHIDRYIYNYDKDNGNEDDMEFYADISIDYIRKQMGMFFVQTKKIGTSSYKEIIQDLLVSQGNIFRKVSNKVTEITTQSRVLDDILSEIEYYLDNNIEPKDMNDLCTNMFNALFSSVIAPDAVILSEQLILLNEDYKENDYFEDRQIDNELCKMLAMFPDAVMNVACECFADCCAIKELSVSLSEFLFAFIYETRDINKAMSLSINNILRIGVDLRFRYGIQGCLSDEEKKSIENIYNKYNSASFDVGVNIQDYIQRIDDILSRYKQIEASGDDLIKYLQVCDTQQIGKDSKFSNLYANFNNPNKTNENDIYNFIGLWKKLAEDKS